MPNFIILLHLQPSIYAFLLFGRILYIWWWKPAIAWVDFAAVSKLVIMTCRQKLVPNWDKLQRLDIRRIHSNNQCSASFGDCSWRKNLQKCDEKCFLIKIYGELLLLRNFIVCQCLAIQIYLIDAKSSCPTKLSNL